jgi:hypothetical protein
MNAIRFMSKPAARSFGDLLVWHKAHEFVLAACKLSAAFPKQETYGLSSQFATGGGIDSGKYC